jgi:hypothetical protein
MDFFSPEIRADATDGRLCPAFTPLSTDDVDNPVGSTQWYGRERQGIR